MTLQTPLNFSKKSASGAARACEDYSFQKGKAGVPHVFTYYASPSLTLVKLQDMLNSLVSDAEERIPKLIADDFNVCITPKNRRE